VQAYGLAASGYLVRVSRFIEGEPILKSVVVRCGKVEKHTLLVTPCLSVVCPFVGPLSVVGCFDGRLSLLLQRLRLLSLLPVPLSFCLLACVAVSPLPVFRVCVCVCVYRCVCGMLSPNLSLLVLRVCIFMCVGACACVSVSACVCLCLPLCMYVCAVVCLNMRLCICVYTSECAYE